MHQLPHTWLQEQAESKVFLIFSIKSTPFFANEHFNYIISLVKKGIKNKTHVSSEKERRKQ